MQRFFMPDHSDKVFINISFIKYFIIIPCDEGGFEILAHIDNMDFIITFVDTEKEAFIKIREIINQFN
jgi:hypothetical protein